MERIKQNSKVNVKIDSLNNKKFEWEYYGDLIFMITDEYDQQFSFLISFDESHGTLDNIEFYRRRRRRRNCKY